jgi:hypothetical protein
MLKPYQRDILEYLKEHYAQYSKKFTLYGIADAAHTLGIASEGTVRTFLKQLIKDGVVRTSGTLSEKGAVEYKVTAQIEQYKGPIGFAKLPMKTPSKSERALVNISNEFQGIAGYFAPFENKTDIIGALIRESKLPSLFTKYEPVFNQNMLKFIDQIIEKSLEKGVIITGEPGIGKSMFLYFIWKRLKERDILFGKVISDEIKHYHHNKDIVLYYDDLRKSDTRLIDNLVRHSKPKNIIITCRTYEYEAIDEETDGALSDLFYRKEMKPSDFSDEYMKNILNLYLSAYHMDIEEAALDLIIKKSKGLPLYLYQIVKQLSEEEHIKKITKRILEKNHIPAGITELITDIIYKEVGQKKDIAAFIILHGIAKYTNHGSVHGLHLIAFESRVRKELEKQGINPGNFFPKHILNYYDLLDKYYLPHDYWIDIFKNPTSIQNAINISKHKVTKKKLESIQQAINCSDKIHPPDLIKLSMRDALASLIGNAESGQEHNLWAFILLWYTDVLEFNGVRGCCTEEERKYLQANLKMIQRYRKQIENNPELFHKMITLAYSTFYILRKASVYMKQTNQTHQNECLRVEISLFPGSGALGNEGVRWGELLIKNTIPTKKNHMVLHIIYNEQWDLLAALRRIEDLRKHERRWRKMEKISKSKNKIKSKYEGGIEDRISALWLTPKDRLC